MSNLPPIPLWTHESQIQNIEHGMFVAGAVLGHIDLLLSREDVPKTLIRDRMALEAAHKSALHQARKETQAEIRDAVHFADIEDEVGPAGAICLSWQKAARKPVSVETIIQAIPNIEEENINRWMFSANGHPIKRTSILLEAAIKEMGGQDIASLILADSILAMDLSWKHMVPLLGVGMNRADTRLEGDELRLACCKAIIKGGDVFFRLANELSRRKKMIEDITPKLRSKGRDECLRMFLSKDSISPSMLPISNRSARRFCERLVELGVAKELTGRSYFRLYGL